MSYPQLDAVMNIILACVDLAVEFLEGEIPVGSSAFEHVTQAFHQLPSAQTLVEERSKSISQARNAILRSVQYFVYLPYTLNTGEGETQDKKGAAFFSAYRYRYCSTVPVHARCVMRATSQM